MKEVEFIGVVEEQDFINIANLMINVLGWKLIRRIDVDASVWIFQKEQDEIILVYDDIAGIFLKTHIETYPLDVLKNEIDTIYPNKHDKAPLS